MKTWDDLWRSSATRFNRWPETELVRWAASLEPGSRVLEVGCGGGANLRALESFDLIAWGVDIAEEAVLVSQRLSDASQVKVGSAVELPFDPESFDAVCDVQCFQHLQADELPRAYSEARRVLVPHGRFFEMFLVGGQEHYDLGFTAFDAGAVDANFILLEWGVSYRLWKGRSYTYLILECEKS